jgi:hypothetical protein
VSRVVGVLAVIAALSAVGAAHSATWAAAANRITFADERGESPDALDVSKVVVSSTADGLLVFRVEIPTNSTFTEDMRLEIPLDVDLDATTGQEGMDAFLLAEDGVEALYACQNPPTCDVFDQPRDARVDFSYRSGATFTLDAGALHSRTRFRFRVGAYEHVLTNDLVGAHIDFAPREGGWWTFDSRALVTKSLTASPKTPRAGATFVLRLAALRTATGSLLARGSVSCAFRIAGRKVAPRSSGFVRHRAVCSYDVPAGTRGSLYRAAITVRAGASAVSRSLSGRVS